MRGIFIFLFLFLVVQTSSLLFPGNTLAVSTRATWWEIQSIDTMKDSRDLAREKLNDQSYDVVIDNYVSAIAASGATHVAIGTPYDEEFVPYMRRWVASARKYRLSVWFRGNWSGWEGWFNYPKITRAQHLEKTRNFILKHPDLFVDGDLFSSCPECENGGPGDPRKTGDVKGFREFFKSLYQTTKSSFSDIKVDVQSNLFSVNGDVAKLVMDPATTSALGGIVVVDHYVTDPNQLVADLDDYARISQGKVVLGEFGAPIPDLHPQMNATAQAEWIKTVLSGISKSNNVVGLNYWTGFNSSTKIWNNDGLPRPAVSVLYDYYVPRQVVFTVTNEIGQPIKTAQVHVSGRDFTADRYGVIRIAIPESLSQVQIDAPDYNSQGVVFDRSTPLIEVVLQKTEESFSFKVRKLTYRIFNAIIQR